MRVRPLCALALLALLALLVPLVPPPAARARPDPGGVSGQSDPVCASTLGVEDLNLGFSFCARVLQRGDALVLVAEEGPPGGTCVASVTYLAPNREATLSPAGGRGQVFDAAGRASWRWSRPAYPDWGDDLFAVASCAAPGNPAPNARGTGYTVLRDPPVARPVPPRPAPAPASTPAPRGSAFTAEVAVSGAGVSPGGRPALRVHTRIGAVCRASVRYADGGQPPSLDPSPVRIGPTGIARWTWRARTPAAPGTGAVSCAWKGQTRAGTARFAAG